MAKVRAADVEISARDSDVVLRIPVDRQKRMVVLSPADAVAVSNQLGNAAADILNPPDLDLLPLVREFKFIPFGQQGGPGHAVLRMDTTAGPMLVRIGARDLAILSTMADGVLEHSQPAGIG